MHTNNTSSVNHISSQPIQTSRLQIAPFGEQDRPALARLLLDDAIKKTYMIPDLPDEAALDKLICAFLALSHAEDRFVRGIYLDNDLIGFVNDVDITETVIELGYVIAPAHWGQGYASEMLRAVMPALLDKGFACVLAGAFSENTASIRVMEKCGMEKIARTDVIEYRGVVHQCVYYRYPKGL